MSYCLNPVCSAPQNSADEVCQSCGTALKLCDRYQALKPIGQGGFGRTFLAVDLSESMKPRCVIKQLYPQQTGGDVQEKASDLFRQEAQQLKLAGQYPSIPTFLDYFEQDGYQYLVQEFIEGQNLAEVLATGRTFTESEVKDLLETMLETVDFLHHRQIIHRDIKPANIIQTLNDRFVLVDLGAAKLMTGTALGQTGTVIGSAEYVAPEQLRGKAIFASDLYSLGATCVTLLTGMSPFSLFDTSTGSWEWRDYLSAPVGDRLGKVLDRLLIGPTKQRYKSADEVLQELEQPSLVKERSIDPWQKEALVETEEKSLPSQDFQVPVFASLEIDFSPHQMFIRRTGKSINRSGVLENIIRGAIVTIFICSALLLIVPYSTSMRLFILITAFFVWFFSLFLIILTNSGSTNGSEVHLMKSSRHQTVFILNSRGRKKERKIRTRNITCVEVTRALNDTSFEINIWIDQIYYKLVKLKEIESMKLANSIADWLDVYEACKFDR